MQKVRLFRLGAASASLITFCAIATAATFQEDFSSAPAAHQWAMIGATNLFHWNSTNQNLEATWDSSRSNSYYCRPLGTILTRNDDFRFAFDLTLTDVLVGPDTNKPYAFQLAAGLLNLSEAITPNFLRGSAAGTNSPDLFEFDYWPDDGSGFASLDVSMAGTNGQFEFYYANVPLSVGETYNISIAYTASNHMVEAIVSRTNQPYAAITNFFPNSSFSDFRLDHFAVCSYSDAGQDPFYSGSILAQGIIDNLVVTTPPPPLTNIAGALSNGVWTVTFPSQTNWLYTLERSTDFRSWVTASSTSEGTGLPLGLQDTNPLPGGASYRVRAQRP